MDMRLSGLIHSPECDAHRKTMPECFKALKVAVIIDCFEIFMERLSNLLVRAATYMVQLQAP